MRAEAELPIAKAPMAAPRPAAPTKPAPQLAAVTARLGSSAGIKYEVAEAPAPAAEEETVQPSASVKPAVKPKPRSVAARGIFSVFAYDMAWFLGRSPGRRHHTSGLGPLSQSCKQSFLPLTHPQMCTFFCIHQGVGAGPRIGRRLLRPHSNHGHNVGEAPRLGLTPQR